MNVKSFKVIINRFHFNKVGAGAGGSYSYSLGLIIGCIILFVGKGPIVGELKDQFRILGNCPPIPPLAQYFALSEK